MTEETFRDWLERDYCKVVMTFNKEQMMMIPKHLGRVGVKMLEAGQVWTVKEVLEDAKIMVNEEIDKDE